MQLSLFKTIDIPSPHSRVHIATDYSSYMHSIPNYQSTSQLLLRAVRIYVAIVHTESKDRHQPIKCIAI